MLPVYNHWFVLKNKILMSFQQTGRGKPLVLSALERFIKRKIFSAKNSGRKTVQTQTLDFLFGLHSRRPTELFSELAYVNLFADFPVSALWK